MSKKREILKKNKKIQAQRLEAVNQENEKIKIFIALPIFFLFLGICHTIGIVFDIDPLIYVTRVRTRTISSTSTSFLPIVISIIPTYIVIIILEKSSYLTYLIESAKKQSKRLQKHPRLYSIAKFVYKHPIWSYFIVNISYFIIETFLIYVVKI